MTTSFDDDAFREVEAIVNGDAAITTAQLGAIIERLDEILLICARARLSDSAGGIDVEPAWDYLDQVAIKPGLLESLLVYDRWPIAEKAAAWHAERFDAEAAALLGPVADPVPVLPLTCVAWEAHAQQARRTKPLWWLRSAGLLDDKPDDDQPCPVCQKPRPKSHRRKP